jgi:DNA-binding transcriptional regulator PaaX
MRKKETIKGRSEERKKNVRRKRVRQRAVKKENRKELSRKVKKVSGGVLSTAVDLVLASVFFGIEASMTGYGNVGKASYAAHKDLSEINSDTLKRAFHHLKSKGLVQSVREKNALPKITKEGKRRIASIVPQYDDERVWDGRIYLVTYDLPITKNKERNLLREYIKKIGCGMLQHSVWITPYNPTELIREFTYEKKLNDEPVLVSSFGKDGAVGGMDLRELLDDVYKLYELNIRYNKLITQVNEGGMTKDQIIFSYLSILRDDPQLPFELLGEDWLGEKAYKLAMHVHS